MRCRLKNSQYKIITGGLKDKSDGSHLYGMNFEDSYPVYAIGSFDGKLLALIPQGPRMPIWLDFHSLDIIEKKVPSNWFLSDALLKGLDFLVGDENLVQNDIVIDLMSLGDRSLNVFEVVFKQDSNVLS